MSNGVHTVQLSEKDSYRFIQAAYVANRIDFQLDLHWLARAGSPVYFGNMALAPSLLIMITCMGVVIAGLFGYLSFLVVITAMVSAVILQVFMVRSWVIYRVNQKAMTALLSNLSSWRSLWTFGGVAIILSNDSKIRCVAPTGDWEAFVRAYLTDLGQQLTPDVINAQLGDTAKDEVKKEIGLGL